MVRTKHLPLFLILAAFAACKKDRTCTCVDTVDVHESTESGFESKAGTSVTSVTHFSRVKKNDPALNMCKDVNYSGSHTYTVGTASVSQPHEVKMAGRTRCTLE